MGATGVVTAALVVVVTVDVDVGCGGTTTVVVVVVVPTDAGRMVGCISSGSCV